MKYISVDLETSGIDWSQDQVLEIAMIVEDTEDSDLPLEYLPTFHCYVRHDRISGSPGALAMHQRIFEIISSHTPNGLMILKPEQVCDYVKAFLSELDWPKDSSRINLNMAGKNVCFDKLFLATLKGFSMNGLRLQFGKYQFRSRDLDPGILAFDTRIDEAIPCMEVCCERLGVPLPGQEHTALGDARLTVQCLRKLFNAKN